MTPERQTFIGQPLPRLQLPSTQGGSVRLCDVSGFVVLVCFPYTGRPGVKDPPGWDDIPGAHGSTPQVIGYSKAYAEFERLGVKVFGMSLQSLEWQREFVERFEIAVPLLADQAGEFSTALRLPRFHAGAREFLKRITLISAEGVVTAERNPVPDPAGDAAEVLKLFQRR